MSATHQINREFHFAGHVVTTTETVEGDFDVNMPGVEIPAGAVDHEVDLPGTTTAWMTSLYIGVAPAKPRAGGEPPLLPVAVKLNRDGPILKLAPGAPYIWTENANVPRVACATLTALYVTNPSKEPVKLNFSALLKRPEPKASSAAPRPSKK